MLSISLFFSFVSPSQFKQFRHYYFFFLNLICYTYIYYTYLNNKRTGLFENNIRNAFSVELDLCIKEFYLKKFLNNIIILP